LDLLTRVVAQFESFRASPYPDPVGKMTCGFGHLIKDGEALSTPMTEEQGWKLLDADIAQQSRFVDTMFHGVWLAPYEIQALTSFCFNTGAGNLAGSTLRKRIMSGDKRAASHEFIRWVWATHSDGTRVRLSGLVKRRDIEAIWFLGAHPHTISRLAGIPADTDDE
jgi:lysozyme